ncbi:lipopolysaccharide assembly protein LapB [Eoetvoesiella caeni]|uniref:Lipopolysaccharide assembly protein B n=1 Tax=Eoetvoesiella caeni TaxID=645616 RepID=A0A366HJY1_9BURK|nr:lipopolysaccharide assembly protein LapB [Eoetvoesiella caeni]MCI2807338.1 lipopolysaccharide assembly protein LapB [Eoetvoesiella caeni]NYT53267.1 lipopolysaccharide assembly protein LapB [Eoetvoesiella caeni]RBP43248.1 lipopolysaccharide biosynthesis regulator YciM [Eoetvoesiella caeni]
MDFEPWWLISVPVLFALGWIAARVDIRQMLSETRALPDSYFKGLNFILNEEPDRAIDAFVEVAKLDPETTELHFALGSLFRRRGEMERAIRVHLSLLARADLPVAEREHAQHEIAQDYLKAGMLDRAELAFQQVMDTRFAVPAVRALIRIYESEHDWPRAIEAVKRLRALIDEPVPQLVHYQCEQVQAALAAKPPNIAEANAALDAADNAAAALHGQERGQPSQARIAMLRAALAKLSNNAESERTYLESVLAIAPEYGGLIADDLIKSYRSVGREADGLAVLKKHYLRHPTLDTFNVVFREMRAQQGHDVAWEFARDALRAQPSLLGLDRLLEIELAAGDRSSLTQITSDADLSLLRSLIHKHTQRLDRYACNVCGFEARHFYWQCPGCNSWETYQPLRLEEVK